MCCMHQMFNACMHLNWFWRLMANLMGRKLEKWQKRLNFWGKKVWHELLSKYVIYAPNVECMYVLKLVLEINGKFDG